MAASILRSKAALLKAFFAFVLAVTGYADTCLAASNELISVRVGTHKNFDRLVFEFASETPSYVQLKGAQKLEILFKNVGTGSNFKLPSLPQGLVAIRGIDAYQVGKADIAFEITLARDVAPSELPLSGKPFRLAVDLSPKVAEKTNDKPEYVPGDKPIQTRFAEADTSLKPESNEEGKPSEYATDPAKANSILAYYYLSKGDTYEAQQKATAYQEQTGKSLDDIPGVQTPESEQEEAKESASNDAHGTQYASWWFTAVITAAAGLFGGVIGAFVALRLMRKKLTAAPKSVAQNARDLSESLQHDVEALKAKLQDPAPVATPVVAKAAVAVQATVEATPEAVDATEESQESLMDRRVKRVLDLAASGKDIPEIAEELEMSQDEVKLILDLNM